MKKSELRQLIKEEMEIYPWVEGKVIKYLEEYRDFLEEDAESDADNYKIDDLSFLITTIKRSQ